MKKVLTIAGSDSSGGAGIQADLKTMLANGVYGMSAVTALTAQNTQGVRMVQEVSPEFLAAELDAVFEDIRPDAVKIGMVASPALIHVIAEKLQGYGAEHVVVDPVMVATSGAKLLADDAVEVLVQELFPLAEVITPNIPELSVLTGQEIADEAAFQRAAEHLAAQAHVNVLAKGGHSAGEASDLLVTRSAEAVNVHIGRRQGGEMVPRHARRESQHARHGLHALERDCGKPRQRFRPCGVDWPREVIPVRGAAGEDGPWHGQRAGRPQLESPWRFLRELNI